MDASSTTLLPSSVRLIDPRSFPAWYAQLKYHARARGVWNQIDPDRARLSTATTAQNNASVTRLSTAAPTPVTRSSTAAPTPTSAEPDDDVAPELPDSDAEADELRIYQIKSTIYAQRQAKIQSLWNWVITTVDPQRLELAVLRVGDDGSLRALIRELKNDLCPSDDDWREQVRDTYQEIAIRPQRDPKRQTPRAWLDEWTRAHANALLIDLQEIKGILPIKDFLRSASAYTSEWASRELENLSRPLGGAPSLTLEQYARWFSQLLYDKERTSASTIGIYATLGGRTDEQGYMCPCKGAGKHRWKPADCRRLRFAITGVKSAELQREISKDEIQEIQKRLSSERWNKLAEELRALGWQIAGSGALVSSITYPESIRA